MLSWCRFAGADACRSFDAAIMKLTAVAVCLALSSASAFTLHRPHALAPRTAALRSTQGDTVTGELLADTVTTTPPRRPPSPRRRPASPLPARARTHTHARARVRARFAGTKFEEEDEKKNPEKRPGHQVKGMAEIDPETAAKQQLIRDHQQGCPRLAWPEEIRTIMSQPKAFATLSTLRDDGFPLGSIVGFAVDAEGSPIFCFSGMSAHTKNILKVRAEKVGRWGGGRWRLGTIRGRPRADIAPH